MSLSLRKRYSLIIVTLTVLFVGALGSLLLYQFNDTLERLSNTTSESSTKYLREQIDKRGYLIASLLAENLVNPVYQYDMDAIYELIKNVKTQSDIIYVHVYDTDGQIIHDGGEFLNLLGETIEDQDIISAIQTPGKIFNKVKGDTLVYAMPIWIGDVPLGGVSVGISLQSVVVEIEDLETRLGEIGKSTLHVNTVTVLISIAVLSAFGILFSIFIAGRLINPIKQLSRQARMIESGKYGTTIETARVDELGELVQAFNGMSQQLQNTTVSKEYLESIISSMTDTMMVIRPDHSIELVNNAISRLLEYDKDELIGRPVNMLFDKKDSTDIDDWIDRAVSKGPLIAEDDIYLTKSGRKIPMSMSTAVMLDDSGETLHVIALAQDNTDRIIMQEQLRTAKNMAIESNNAKSAFLANMSHEIRTPLTAIIGFSEIMRTRGATEEESKKYLEIILSNSKHLLHIISDILDLSKIEAECMDLESIHTTVKDIVDEVYSALFQLAADKQLKFEIEYAYPVPTTIITDPVRLKQILLNLCSNAIKFTKQGTVRLVISYLADQQQVCFQVIDSGVGMNEEQIKRVFEAFVQADVSTTRKYGGTGLGLSLSRQLAERLGGSLTATSELNQGSCFTLIIPIGALESIELIQAAVSEEGQKPVITSEKLIPRLSGNILLAEDNLHNQQLVSIYIKDTGCKVSVVGNGEQVVKEALAGDFDMILMDIQMPFMDGLEATRLLRQRGYEMPIIAVTANAMKSARELYLTSGFDDFISKPIMTANLYRLLARYLSPEEPGPVEEKTVIRDKEDGGTGERSKRGTMEDA